MFWLCSVLVNIDQPKNIMNNFCLLFEFFKILILNLKKKRLDFLSILDHFQALKIKPFKKVSGFEPPSSRVGYPDLSGSTTKIKTFFCVPSLSRRLLGIKLFQAFGSE